MEAKRTTAQENDNIYLVIFEGYVTKIYTVFSRARIPYNNNNNNNNNNKKKEKEKKDNLLKTLYWHQGPTHTYAPDTVISKHFVAKIARQGKASYLSVLWLWTES